MVLDGIEPRAVMGFFEQLCAIPHGSGNTKAISDYCARFARERALEYHQDELNNIMIIKPASPEYEASPPVILQGHLDMVCEKDADCTIDFMSDGLDLATDGKYVFARGTTLGGDDGIAVAIALALLDSQILPHPRLEAVFTVDEETGMYGAAGLDVSPLQGRVMLNIDSEDEGVFTVGCAGGARACCVFPARRERAELMTAQLCVSGLQGGHSGMEIDKGRGNSNLLMGRVLRALADAAPVRLVSLSGGAMDNAIPLETRAVVALPPENAGVLLSVVEHMDAVLKNELRASDSGVYVSADISSVRPVSAVTAEDSLVIIDALVLFPNGVQEMSMDIPGLVQTSLNLGILKLEEEHLCASFSLRSSVGSQKELLKKKLERIAARLGGSVSFSGEYPAWEYQADSPLRELMVRVYREQYGAEPEIMAIHAGLECGLLAEKLPGLDCVSFGPDLIDIHTCREKMDIESVQRVWAFLLEVLKRMK